MSVTGTKEYRVVPFHTGLFSGSLSDTKLQNTLNEYAAAGWRLARTIHETKRRYGIFNRETHFLVFERDRV